MLTIKFYSCADDPRVLDKDVGNMVYSCEANVLGNCSIKNPSLVLKYDSRLLNVNYFKIEEWNRFYFMGEPVLSPGGRCLVTGSEDVLYSNKDAILNLNAYCVRCESKFERYAVDSAPLSLVTTNITTLQFSNHYFSGNGQGLQYVLTVKGGNYVPPEPSNGGE